MYIYMHTKDICILDIFKKYHLKRYYRQFVTEKATCSLKILQKRSQ